MSEKLSFPPLCYSLIQVIFNPILQIENYIPAIQEQMRKSGYPDFSEGQLPPVVFNVQLNQPIKTETQKRWLFTDTEKHNGYVLNSEWFVFHTTSYKTSDYFIEDAIKGINILHAAVKLNYIQRIGMRYINIISPKPDEEVKLYLNSSVGGIMGERDEGFLSATSESIQKIANGTLVIRTLLGSNLPSHIMPVDLMPLNLIPLKPEASDKPMARALLDEDFYMEERFDFDIDLLRSKLILAHEQVERAFNLAVTEYAFSVWR